MPTPQAQKGGKGGKGNGFLEMEKGLCTLRIRDIFSACAVWFTFIFRKQEHLAVGSLGMVLLTLVVTPLWLCHSLAFCTFIVSYSKGFVKRFLPLLFFSAFAYTLICRVLSFSARGWRSGNRLME